MERFLNQNHHKDHLKGKVKNKGDDFITWISDLINNIPNILSYIMQGYVFLVIYYWITFKDNNDLKNLIIKSIAVSYILKNIFDWVCIKTELSFTDETHYTICLVFSSAIAGFLIGEISTQGWFNFVLNKVHIGRTTNPNIWNDAIKQYTWLRVFMKDGTSYLGQFLYGEPFKSEPVIVLATYQKLDTDASIIFDHSDDPNEFIMINTKNFDRIEIIYTDKEEIKTYHKQKFNHFINRLDCSESSKENGNSTWID